MDTLHDRYEIRHQLGKKAGRQTLLAFDLITQQQVILKLLTFSADFVWDDLKQFEREIETLKSLTHPAIPTYLDSFELNSPTQKGFVLVQSYLEAPSLEEHLQAGREFGEIEVKQIVKSLLEILRDLHDRHPPLIHRDIKPSNILLGKSPSKVYLIDFGSVQTLVNQAGKTVTVVGTYGYMPPEQFGGISTPASDLYSVGMTAIALLTGTHPADLPQDNFRIQFTPRSPITQHFIDWLQQITEPHPNQRFISAEHALSALNAPIERSTYSKPATPNFLRDALVDSVRMSIKAATVSAAIGTVFAMLMYGLPGLVFGAFGFSISVVWGIAVGTLNGLIVGTISQLKFCSLKNSNNHQITVAVVSVFSIFVIGLLAFTAKPVDNYYSPNFRLPTLPAIIITAIAVQFSNYELVQKWYRRKR
ncbi:serine/threonine protein kinase [Leptolyngbya sp. AN03gr2]|uniref:serine/threonine protein kinase n=1 Tax=unclassified Leptolyngbya TaxID=2650499 RepID=UPI003D316BAB